MDTIDLLNEIELMKSIDHPNVVKLYEIVEDSTYIYLVMELLEDGRLFDKIIEMGGTLSEKDCKRIIKQIFDALFYCHSLGIMHRDLKPENLLLTKSKSSKIGDVKIGDFGLATKFGNEAKVTQVCGTPIYVAPEVLKEQPYGKECDLWSMGVLIYILLCGEPPFYYNDRKKLFELIKAGKLTMEQPEWATVSDEAKDLIKNLLTTNPAKRITTPEIKNHAWFAIE